MRPRAFRVVVALLGGGDPAHQEIAARWPLARVGVVSPEVDEDLGHDRRVAGRRGARLVEREQIARLPGAPQVIERPRPRDVVGELLDDPAVLGIGRARGAAGVGAARRVLEERDRLRGDLGLRLGEAAQRRVELAELPVEARHAHVERLR
jgi:hypothetical protein